MGAKKFIFHRSGKAYLSSAFSAMPMVFLLLYPLIILYPLEPRPIDHVASGINTGISPAHSVRLTPEPDHSQWEWVEVSPPVQDSISACGFLSADDGWVVSVEGTLLHWDGKNWVSFPNPAAEDALNQLYAIAMLSSDNGWVVGQSGLVLHWDGTEWKRLSAITDSDLFDISFVSKDQGFAAGGRGPLGDKDADWTVIGWNGKQWNRVAFPRKPGGWRVDLLRFTSDQEGWASALNSFYRWDGKAWVEYLSKANNRLFFTLYDMSALSQTDVWAVGTNADYNTGDQGVIIHWDGVEWKKVFTTQYDLVSIRMFSPDMGWAIGIFKNPQNLREQKSVLWYWDGVQWSEVPTTTEVGNGEICGYDPKHAWIFGGKRVYTGPYSSEFHPVLFKLVEKPALAPSATVTPTPVPLQAITPTPTAPAVLTATFSDQHTTVLATKVFQPEGEQQIWVPIVWIGSVVIGFAILFVIIRVRKR